MNKFKKTFIGVLLVGLAMSITGCKIVADGSNNGHSGSEAQSSAHVPSSYAPVGETIGVNGGTVGDGNITLNVPANALSADTPITAQYIGDAELISENLPMGFMAGAEFGPSGTTFDQPVSVSLKLNQEAKVSEPAVFCYNETYDLWEYVTDATVSDGNAIFEITHFSKYKVLNRTKTFLNEWTNYVRHGRVNGMSDAEIADAFKDYLLNEQHIMDYYIYYNGYWYEPCGFTLSGAYKIDGVEGDPNQLILIEGEKNKVGDKYGMCHIDSAISSKNKIAGASENSEIFDIMVLVEYKLIKPDIDLIPAKKKLAKGESTTISVRCHYVNVSNFFDEFKDLDLDGYLLRITKPTHFSTDKSSFITDLDGRGSFRVTALENNKAETITVTFDVTGDFGTHAEGNVTLNSAGLHISGHIKEEKHMTFILNFEEYGITTFTTTQIGTFDLVVEYDFEGEIVEQEETLGGNLEISNVTASFSSIGTHAAHENVTAQYDPFSYSADTNTFDQSIAFEASIADNDCSLIAKESSKDLAIIVGSGGVVATTALGSYTEPVSYTITFGTSSNLLLDFTTDEGTYTQNATSLIDKYTCIADYEGDVVEFEDWNFEILTNTETVTQTITVGPSSPQQ